jgi:hypothetical protein
MTRSFVVVLLLASIAPCARAQSIDPDGKAAIADRVAQVWMPYDLYVGNQWSHCGVDTFTLMKREGRWRVAALIYTIEQPPACRKHPAGPPGH